MHNLACRKSIFFHHFVYYYTFFSAGEISQVYNPGFSNSARPTYTLTVVAIDGISTGNDTQYLTVTVTVTTTVPATTVITDTPNDSPPYFLPAFYNFELPVETPPGQYVGFIFAYDDDPEESRFLL